jgi:ABC-2 type transport system permease protein
MGDRLKKFKFNNILQKYFSIFKISWQDSLVYKLTFIFRRLRVLILLLSNFFFWLAVFQNNQTIGSYNARSMLTYIIGTFLLAELVLSSLSIEIGFEIGSGNLSNTLLKPVNYFNYWLSRDWAHKTLNLFFILLEIGLLILILRPPLYFDIKLINILVIAGVLPLLLILNFYINVFISLLSFWFPEHNGWPQRFLFNILLMFFAGMYFPFDLLPKILSNFFQVLPTGLLMFFPLQLYLNRLSIMRAVLNILLIIVWLVIFRKLNQWIWAKGLKKYTSEGR